MEIHDEPAAAAADPLPGARRRLPAADVNGDAGAAATAAAAGAAIVPLVSSSDHNPHDSSDDEPGAAGIGTSDLPADPHYDENQDDEDEAWVYRHMRGGLEEEFRVACERERQQQQQEHEHEHQASEHKPTGTSGSEQEQEQRIEDGQALDVDMSNATNNRADASAMNPNPPDMSQILALKPRNSDAVLSCPCCFTIVCMDSQRHVKYVNQFRAMFVMNIGVRWDKKLRWDDDAGELVDVGNSNNDETDASHSHSMIRVLAEGGHGHATNPIAIPNDEAKDSSRNSKASKQGNVETTATFAAAASSVSGENEEEMYYSVHCASCHTEVAYLNMEDEVYHFVNCLASG